LLTACAGRPQPPSLTIAAAADLKFAMDELADEFTREYPDIALRPSYGSSGNFYAQIRNGAPFDLFLSADLEYPRRLAEQGIGTADSLFVYGTGRLVVWVRSASPLDPATALRDPATRRLAIANPRHAPYGRAAEAAMRNLGVHDALKPKLVLGDNVAQALVFVQTGAADAGIVALSLALADTQGDDGRYWEIPQHAYPKIEQGGLILNRKSDAARAFRSFLMGQAGRDILARYGFLMREYH
jgi:molybdate transport system substrate-binding protein